MPDRPAQHPSAEAFRARLRALPAASPLPFALNSRRCLRLDLSDGNPALGGFDPMDTPRFAAWVEAQIARAGAEFAAGGYAENRAIYRMSPLFRAPSGAAHGCASAAGAGSAGAAAQRSVHLGVDLWLAAGTPVHAVLDGTVHSLRDNEAFGDYGPTVVIEHDGFFTLYGHLSRGSLERTQPGQPVRAGEPIGWLGTPDVNRGWPAHLHLQVIRDIGSHRGDFPGVCAAAEQARWLDNSPDPNLLLRLAALETT